MNTTTAKETIEAAYPKLQPLFKYLDSLKAPADLTTLTILLKNLDITRKDLGDACVFGEDDYHRMVLKDSRWYEVVCICWKSGQRTPIHDHKGASCAFRVIEGIATETIFEKSASGFVYPTSSKHQPCGYIAASSEVDIHQVTNTQPPGTDLINIHIYSPLLRDFNIYSLDTRSVNDPKTQRPNDFVFKS
ncbi:MAG: cysteine dioxygenase family protein [Planctomycetes bacterium]|nr:cysteine dioxygenase family protein [Planctomycetota bacterium]